MGEVSFERGNFGRERRSLERRVILGEVIFLGSVIYRKRFIWRTMEKPDGVWEDRLGGGRVWWGEERAREAMREDI